MRVLLELLRIIFIFLFLGGLLSFLLQKVYLLFDSNTKDYEWIASLGIFILLFVLHRNKLQFSGWYKGGGRNKLPKTVSRLLIACSLVLLLMPLILSWVMDGGV